MLYLVLLILFEVLIFLNISTNFATLCALWENDLVGLISFKKLFMACFTSCGSLFNDTRDYVRNKITWKKTRNVRSVFKKKERIATTLFLSRPPFSSSAINKWFPTSRYLSTFS